jgi:hypothetical protein
LLEITDGVAMFVRQVSYFKIMITTLILHFVLASLQLDLQIGHKIILVSLKVANGIFALFFILLQLLQHVINLLLKGISLIITVIKGVNSLQELFLFSLLVKIQLIDLLFLFCNLDFKVNLHLLFHGLILVCTLLVEVLLLVTLFLLALELPI